jgi:transposase
VRVVTDGQVRKLMTEYEKHGQVGKAALVAGMDRGTARKYISAGKLPSELKKPRTWRTRANPFESDWPAIEQRLEAAPELEAKALFEDLMERKLGRYRPGQLRTFQRHVRKWRASAGPPKEVFFAQAHRPGEALQTDFTYVTALGTTIGGEPAPSMLCHSVLPYSNWQWATPCWSESLLALRQGVQSCVFRLGRVTRFHQTDNSTAATHALGDGDREFNEDYASFMAHLGMTPRTIEPGQSHQNGDIEAANGVLKRRLEQHLLLRGSRDFDSLEAYVKWLHGVLDKANRLRADKLKDEMAAMKKLRVKRLAEFTELRPCVSSRSTIRVKRNTYSVPSRLIGERVRVRLFEDRLEVYFAGVLQLQVPRLRGDGGSCIDYRHVIWSLVRKPGAFERYRHREALFPTPTFRRTFDELSNYLSSRQADLDYLRILHLAASTMQSDVEAALSGLLEAGALPRWERVKELVAPAEPTVPAMAEPVVDLTEYDALLPAGRRCP